MSMRRTWTRREVIKAGALAAAAGVSGLSAAAPRRLGVQLYTVRDLLKDKAPETIQAIAAMGYQECEIVRADSARIAGLATAAGLTPVSMHIEAPWVTGNWAPYGAATANAERPTWDRQAADIRKLGITNAIVAYLLPPERGKTGDDYKRFAEQLNTAGQAAKKEGVTVGYHNHAFEFAPLADGQRGYDVLAANIDPAVVKLEVDVFWVSVAGQDVSALIKRLGPKVSYLHLKDVQKGTPTNVTSEQAVPRTSFAAVGTGTLDFAPILAAADAVGVKHLFVEQDVTPGDPLVSLKESITNLRKL